MNELFIHVLSEPANHLFTREDNSLDALYEVVQIKQKDESDRETLTFKELPSTYNEDGRMAE